MHPRLVTEIMAEQADVRRIVAELLGMEPASIDADTPLGLSSSLARARLDAVLRRQLGVKCAAVYTARRFGDLERALLGEGRTDREALAPRAREATESRPPPLHVTRPSSAGLRCGVDIVEIDELPASADFWEHEFYRHAFSGAEIAYCSTQAVPRESFAARWAAKEAIKKLSGRYLAAEPAELEILADAEGAPVARWRGDPLPIALSLSHSRSAAVAFAVEMASARDIAERVPEPPPKLAASSAPNGEREHAARDQSRLVRAPSAAPRRPLSWALLSLVVTGVAAWALLRGFGVV
jgi:holo-[acyl-carrier protein] synthase